MHRIIGLRLLFLMLVLFCANSTVLYADDQRNNDDNVIINEIHYDPDIKTELVEYIELYNSGPTDVNLAGWYFRDGISYCFPAFAILPAGGYIIVTQNSAHVQTKWSEGRTDLDADLVYGSFEGKLENNGEKIELCNAAGEEIDQVDYQLGFPWPTVGDPVPENSSGTGHSIQLINPMIDNDLGGSWRSASPTPSAFNESVDIENAPPHIRQVKHSPKQPKSGETVTITTKVTDSDGVSNVSLLYQFVEPGDYININQWQYRINWYSVGMHDDGLNGDEIANDDIYTVQMPGTMQVHRRLVRYRIEANDNLGYGLTVPYADDPQPNFAYFVYDGAPAWSGAVKPGDSGPLGEVVEYGTEVMNSLPVYHLISRKSDVEDCTWYDQIGWTTPEASEFKWYGTMVYDGEVYDHIRYRVRGGTHRYRMGKNMWKFDFNRGHYFQARDDYGRKYDIKWDKLNFSACIQQGDYLHRGEQGMFEAVSFKLFNLMGVEASKTDWLHFRIIDEADETGPTQYDGDFWGLYMTIEQMDGRFLDEHNLPDGNLYKIDNYNGELNNQGPTAVTDGSDLDSFMYAPNRTEQWWRENVSMERYYSYRCVVEGIHHGDIGYGKNFFFYLNPETNIWSMLPWDVDLTWAENMYGNGIDIFMNQGDIFSHTTFFTEYQNRMREFLDLLFNADQLYQILDELANIIDPPTGAPTLVEADRAMWDYNPIMISPYVHPGKAGQGRFYQQSATKDFRGMVQLMKDYVIYVTNNTRYWYGQSGPSMNEIAADPSIPQTPIITATCPEAYPVNALTFESSPFSDPQGNHTFSAMKWRIAEVEPDSQIVIPQDPQSEALVLVPDTAEWKYFKGTEEPSHIQGAWRQIDFDDSDWLVGHTPIGYGESFIETQLDDMRSNYTTVYIRREFDLADPDVFNNLRLEVKYDDGVNIWINNVHVVSGNTNSDELPYDAVVNNRSEDHSFNTFILSDPGSYLISGTNVVAAQVINTDLRNSSDCFIDIRLTGDMHEADESPSTPLNFSRKPRKYEIDSVWESEDITDFNNSIQIPAGAVKVGRTYRVRCRMKDNTDRWSHWSLPIQFEAGAPLSAGILNDLRITELMYNPVASTSNDSIDSDEFEFIELKNIGDEILDLTYVSFADGITFDFNNGNIASLGPGDFVLVVRNKDAFESHYGTGLSDKIAGQYSGKLSNSGENISLMDLWNGTIVEFEYNDSRSWPLSADGGGHSLVPLTSALLSEPDGSLKYSGNWRASSYIGGSPGMDDLEPVASVVLNEIVAHTDYSNPLYPEFDSNDWIELYNATGTNINLSNWYLSDIISDLKKWAIPAVDIAAYSSISFNEVTDFHNPVGTGFGLDKKGEQLFLSCLPGTSEDRIVDSVRFKGQEDNISLGRYPDGGKYWFNMIPSKNSLNTEPVPDIVIDELMYHPEDVNDEYIELYNPTPVRIYLENTEGTWRLDGTVEYIFPTGTSIPADGRLIVVGFDPVVDNIRLDTFIVAYNSDTLTPGEDIVGPWSGNLSNSSERLALERPQPPDWLGDSVSWVIVDEVIYADVSPWPEAADGTGKALQRISATPSYSGSNPNNWLADFPTLGDKP